MKFELNSFGDHRWVEIEDFVPQTLCKSIIEEINHSQEDTPQFWVNYNTPIENKSTLNYWHSFGPNTYQTMSRLCSATLTKEIGDCFGYDLQCDFGLHGGGVHQSKEGGRLEPHLDYAHHPKQAMARVVNAILYLTSTGVDHDGGELGFWDRKNEAIDEPFGQAEVVIQPKAGKLVIFDVSGFNWHGLVNPVSNGARVSLASYYLTDSSQAKIKTSRRAAVFGFTKSLENKDGVKDAVERRYKKAGL